MLNPHASLGIADIVFYSPIPFLAAYLAFIRHGRPRMAWCLLITFSCCKFHFSSPFFEEFWVTVRWPVRLASGIVSILYENNPSSVGLLIAAIITLNVGVIPLLVCTIGFLRIISTLESRNSSNLRIVVRVIRAGFGVGIGLLVAGGVLTGMYETPGLPNTGSALIKAGYIVIACILASMFVLELHLWRQLHVWRKRRLEVHRSSKICLRAITAAMPFQIVRISYAFLTVFDPSNPKWNALSGSIGAFVGMALLMEYIVVVMYITTGFMIERVQKTTYTGGAITVFENT